MLLGYLPVQSRTGPRQKLNAAVIDPRGHTIASGLISCTIARQTEAP
jgi:hypothetical protein